MSEPKETLAIAKETMLGDLISICQQEIQILQKPWEKCTEKQQREILERIEKGCRHAVDQAVNIIASDGRTTISATVEQVVFKDGIKAVMTVSSANPGRHALADHCNDSVLIVITDSDQFKNMDTAPTPTPDQAELVEAA